MYIYKDFWRFWKDTSFPIDNNDYWKTWMIYSIIFIIAIPAFFVNVEYLYWYLIGAYFVVSFIPNTSMTMRRLNTNGVSKKNIYWILLPIIGIFIVIAKMVFDENEDIDPNSMKDSNRNSRMDPSKRIIQGRRY